MTRADVAVAAGDFEAVYVTGGVESWVERDHLVALDFDPAVTAVASRPFWLLGRAGGRVRRHAPDFFAGWRYAVQGSADPVQAANVQWLVGYRHPRCHDEPVAALLREVFAEPRQLCVVPAEPHAHPDMLDLGVEVHRPLDVDQHRRAAAI